MHLNCVPKSQTSIIWNIGSRTLKHKVKLQNTISQIEVMEVCHPPLLKIVYLDCVCYSSDTAHYINYNRGGYEDLVLAGALAIEFPLTLKSHSSSESNALSAYASSVSAFSITSAETGP